MSPNFHLRPHGKNSPSLHMQPHERPLECSSDSRSAAEEAGSGDRVSSSGSGGKSGLRETENKKVERERKQRSEWERRR